MSTALSGRDEITLKTTVLTTGNDSVAKDAYRTGTALCPTFDQTWIAGTAANCAQKHYHDALTIAAGGSTTIDLSSVESGFTKVRRIVLRLRSPSAGVKIVVGNAASNPFAPWLSTVTVTEDVAGVLYRRSEVDGWSVSGSAKNIKIANPGGSQVIVDVSIVGY